MKNVVLIGSIVFMSFSSLYSMNRIAKKSLVWGSVVASLAGVLTAKDQPVKAPLKMWLQTPIKDINEEIIKHSLTKN